MIITSGYKAEEILYSSAQTVIYRGFDKEGRSVILKVLNNSHPDPQQLARFRLEYEMINRFANGSDQPAGVINAFSLVKHQNSLMIVLEDIAGYSLLNQTNGKEMSVGDFLPLAISIAGVVEQIHKQFVMHRDINPSNIIWNPQKGLLRIIDFGISKVLTREHMEVWSQQSLEGTPAYLSPEQTGRMNRSMDFRSDLYSLGATFYYLLTGKPPFPGNNTLEMVHCHLARSPRPPRDNFPHIPEILSDIILKLLSKEAEQRYQTAGGLLQDLVNAHSQWQLREEISSFILGENDVFERFVLPEMLFGRDAELAKLAEAFQRSNQGGAEMLFVEGAAGVGKSSLVDEISSQITLQGGFFVAGKFNQAESAVPYGPIVQAFRALIKQFLADSTEQLALWKEKLQQALSANSAILCRLITELEIIFGPQKLPYKLSPQQARDQFQLAFLEMVKTICKQKTPLTIFIDDLQWADRQSLHLLERMMIDPELSYFFLIAAFRNDEGDDNRYLQEFRQAIGKASLSSATVTLAPMSLANVNLLIARAAHCGVGEARPLVDLCMEKTNGNPFFLKQFLLTIYGEGLLYLENGRWHWDLEAVRLQAVTENVVELMLSKIKKQGVKTQKILQVASCIGLVFDLETLVAVLGWDTKETESECQVALRQGLILPGDGAHDLTAYLDNPNVTYQFVHDRVHQAAYSLISTKQKNSIHLAIGRLLDKKRSFRQAPEHLFAVTNHLNIGMVLMKDQELQYLATLNLQAGQQAMLSAAHSSAFKYFSAGLDILGEHGWSDQYDLVLQLHNCAAEVAYVADHSQKIEKLVESVKKHARSTLDSINVQEFSILADTSAMQFVRALDNGLVLLRILGLDLPADEPGEEQIADEWACLDEILADKSIDWLLKQSAVSDVQSSSINSVITNVVPVATILGSRWMPFLLIKGMRQIFQLGHIVSSELIISDFAGMCLCGIRDDIESAYKYGQVAMALLEKYPSNQHKMRVFFMYNGGIRHWKEHYLRTILPAYQEGIKAGLEVGDVESVGYILYFYLGQSFFFGANLSKAESEIKKSNNLLITLRNLYLIDFVNVTHQAVLNLMGQSKEPHILTGEKYSEREDLSKLIQTGGKTIICSVSIMQFILRYIFRKFDDCKIIVERIVDNLDGIRSNAQLPIFFFFDSLFHLAVFTTGDEEQKISWLERVESNLVKLKNWARYGPMNLEQMVQLVEAERCRVLGQPAKAQDFYNRAIELARKYEFIHIEAIAFELAGYFYQQQGVEHLARYHLSEARYAYSSWGAVAKVADLDIKFPGFFLNINRAPKPVDGGSDDLEHWSKSTTTRSTTISLDLPSVIKASQAISREIDFKSLVSRLLHIVMENAGAQRGCLVSLVDNRPALLAMVTEHEQAREMVMEFSDGIEVQFSVEVVQYVFRSKEALVLDDAGKSFNFAKTEYVQRVKPKSILCIPLIYQGQVSRVIYLENNLATHSFTPHQVEVIQTLGAQAAISLSNAQVVDELKQAEQDLIGSQQRLRNLSRHQQLLLEHEQKRISQEIHDELGSILTRIRMETDLFKSGKQGDVIEVGRKDLDGLSQLIQQAMLTTRRVSSALRPKTLDQCGIVPALEWLAQQFSSCFFVKIQDGCKYIRLDEEREIILFRIGQEAITNIARHAGATEVTLFLDYDESDITMEIGDNGCGIDFDKRMSAGMGLQGMKERAQQLSGMISFSRIATGGSLIKVSIPRKIDDRFEGCV